jgi:transketolase
VRAVDTARLLAADAVQQAGSGHPGTAISLAPLAYLLFQQVLVHDPADDQWLGRDRFVLSTGHTSLTLYIQLFLSSLSGRAWLCRRMVEGEDGLQFVPVPSG